MILFNNIFSKNKIRYTTCSPNTIIPGGLQTIYRLACAVRDYPKKGQIHDRTKN